MEIKTIIKNAKQNDQMAFRLLLDRFWNDVYTFQLQRTKNENDAEDICIQTFSKAFDKINSYNDNYNFKTWLFTISKNIHIDLLRKQNRSPQNTLNENYYPDVVDHSPTPEDKIISQQNLDELLKAIKQLKPNYQEVIELRYFEDMSYKTISKTLKEPMSNVKVKLLRAKKLLAEILSSTQKD